MLGELTNEQIESLLKKQVVGRIACISDGKPYVVPVNYVYNGHEVISHSGPGKKIEMMRANPQVCFQIDDIQTIFNWESVIAWGKFEEITDMEEKQRAMTALIHRIMPFSENPSDHPSHGLTEKEEDIGVKLDIILFKIVLETKTGRFEHT